MNKHFGKNDVIFLSLLVVVCFVICVVIYSGNITKGTYLTITVDGKKYGTYSLLEEQTISVGNPAINTILIENGKARMLEAECPDQLCVKQKEIFYDKESIICLPNKVVVTVTSGMQSELDAVVN